jgi:hypothetical protein
MPLSFTHGAGQYPDSGVPVVIPNIIHFIWIGNGPPFSLLHYLSVATAARVNRPEAMWLHFAEEPSGPWWERAKPHLRLNPIAAPVEIFGNPLHHYAHQTDVLRLEILLRTGGIYLDLDVVCVNPLAPLLDQPCVMGRQSHQGLCNAVILAEPGAVFIRKWLEAYRTFDESVWDFHSVRLPMHLAASHCGPIRVLDQYAFFYPTWQDPLYHLLWMDRLPSALWWRAADKAIRRYLTDCLLLRFPPRSEFHVFRTRRWQVRKVASSYCVHLWETRGWERYLRDLTPAFLRESDAIFPLLMRRILGPEALREFD